LTRIDPSLVERARNLVAHGAVSGRAEPARTEPRAEEPPDLVALHAVSDGLELADGTRILPRGEVLAATLWLVGERALSWGPDLWVVGERDDLVIVRDLDAAGVRAGGGVLTAPTDGLSRLAREAEDLVSYLEERVGIAPPSQAPERAAQDAAARRDADALAAALARPFYPGAARARAHAAQVLGGLRASAGDVTGALAAFTDSVAARVESAPRGADAAEARAGWRSAALAAEKAGAADVAAACRARATSA
jgi:hypothetical protein